MRKVTIHSDGFGGKGTIILDEEGKVLENVTSADIHIEAQKVTEATLTLQMVPVVAEAHVESMIFQCPLCGWYHSHQCDNSLGNDGVSTQLQPGQLLNAVVPTAVNISVPVPVPSASAPPAAYNPNQVKWNPVLPLIICSKVNAGHTCRVLSSNGAHTIHVDTMTGAVWTDTYRQLTNGTIHHV